MPHSTVMSVDLLSTFLPLLFISLISLGSSARRETYSTKGLRVAKATLTTESEMTFKLDILRLLVPKTAGWMVLSTLWSELI